MRRQSGGLWCSLMCRQPRNESRGMVLGVFRNLHARTRAPAKSTQTYVFFECRPALCCRYKKLNYGSLRLVCTKVCVQSEKKLPWWERIMRVESSQSIIKSNRNVATSAGSAGQSLFGETTHKKTNNHVTHLHNFEGSRDRLYSSLRACGVPIARVVGLRCSAQV